jgi:hypothetical protein
MRSLSECWCETPRCAVEVCTITYIYNTINKSIIICYYRHTTRNAQSTLVFKPFCCLVILSWSNHFVATCRHWDEIMGQNWRPNHRCWSYFVCCTFWSVTLMGLFDGYPHEYCVVVGSCWYPIWISPGRDNGWEAAAGSNWNGGVLQ